MKKKQIEKIPYITLPGVNKDKDVKYIAVTALQIVGGERHLLLEVYKNEEGHMHIPTIRYAMTALDWSIFYPGTGKWRRRRIMDLYGHLCWWQNTDGMNVYNAWTKKNILHSTEDRERIEKFFKGDAMRNRDEWWTYFYNRENHINNKNQARKYERRRERLQERIKNTPALREQELLAWSDKMIFREKHILYYRKKNGHATVCCSACGGVTGGKWKRGESYSAQFEHLIDEPVNKQIGRCPMCGAYGIYFPQGNSLRMKELSGTVFLADRYLENGVVLRYIKIFKDFQLEENIGDSAPHEMVGAYERLSGVEITRTYFMPGKKTQTDYHKHNPYLAKDFWDDCNFSYGQPIIIGEAVVHPDTWEALKGTFLQYCGMEDFARQKKNTLNAEKYLHRYLHYPQIEILSKMGLTEVVDGMVGGSCGIVRDSDARRPDKFLGIRKERVKLLREHNGSLSMLNVLQIENNMGQSWTVGQIKALEELRVGRGYGINEALEIMTIQKLLNNISRYAGSSYGTGCPYTEDRLRTTAEAYFDYLHMRRQLGYDMDNTVYQRPRRLDEAHAKMVLEINREANDKRMREVAERYCGIRRDYRKLRNRYFYQDEKYLIRPARSAEEIVIEGQILHHCVGGDNYLNKHDKGITHILMLRCVDAPELPYITVEIDNDFRIIQWYGAHDKKTDKENVQKWLDDYVKWLKSPRQQTDSGTRRDERVVIAAAV